MCLKLYLLKNVVGTEKTIEGQVRKNDNERLANSSTDAS